MPPDAAGFREAQEEARSANGGHGVLDSGPWVDVTNVTSWPSWHLFCDLLHFEVKISEAHNTNGNSFEDRKKPTQ